MNGKAEIANANENIIKSITVVCDCDSLVPDQMSLSEPFITQFFSANPGMKASLYRVGLAIASTCFLSPGFLVPRPGYSWNCRLIFTQLPRELKGYNLVQTVFFLICIIKPMSIKGLKKKYARLHRYSPQETTYVLISHSRNFLYALCYKNDIR